MLLFLLILKDVNLDVRAFVNLVNEALMLHLFHEDHSTPSSHMA